MEKDADQLSFQGLRVNKDICFTTEKGNFSEKTMKRQWKILQKFSPFLKRLLEPDEEILTAVQATSPMAFLEQMTVGWVIVYIKRCLLVFTNKRILHFPTRADFSPKDSVAQIQHGDIEEIKLSGFLGKTLKLKYRTGKKEKFYYIRSREFKKLKTLIPSIAKGANPTPAMERHHLCPKCFFPLQKNVFSCPNCHLAFKNLKQAIKYSLVYPGGGYFYAGHPIMGAGDAIVETILLAALVSTLFASFSAYDPFAALVSGVIPVVVFLSIEKLITIYDTKHFVNEYIPVDKDAVRTG